MHVRENTRSESDNGQHNTQIQVRHVRLVRLNAETDEAENGTEPKQQREESRQLLDEEAVPRDGLFFAQFIRTDLFEELLRLGGSETVLGIGIVAFAQLFERNSVLVP